ncbi:MAG: hypothetical protein KJN81_10975 [Acidimicrobiia bacterium]|nr:hypothetical protein [Acidimicrobiia bacterium]NNL28939.1 hypothetical protein [Acidimicrobiia bacterium]
MNYVSLHPLVSIVRILVLLQAGIAVMSTVEASFASLAFGPAAGGLVFINLGLATMLFLLANRLGHGSNPARRILRLLQVLLIVWAFFDLTLAVALAGRSIELVGFATRIVLPVYVWRTLRRPDVKASFQARRAEPEARDRVLTGAPA